MRSQRRRKTRPTIERECRQYTRHRQVCFWGSHSIKRPETVGERKTRGNSQAPSGSECHHRSWHGFRQRLAPWSPNSVRQWAEEWMEMSGKRRDSNHLHLPYMTDRTCAAEKDAADAAAGVTKDPGKCDDSSLALTLAGDGVGWGLQLHIMEDRDRESRCRRPVSHPVRVDYTLLRRATRRFFPREEVISHSRRCPPPRWTRSTCDARASKTSHSGQHGPVNGRR